ncbi:S46 family peptidase, partial [Acinetobacter baumannii]
GFNAATLQEEVSAGPNARIYALDSIQDVTEEVEDVIARAPDAYARTQALETLEKQLVAECEREPGYRCRLYSFMGGTAYR